MAFGLSKSEKRSAGEEEAARAETPEAGEDAVSTEALEEGVEEDVAADEAPSAEGSDGDGAYQPMSFRPAFLDDETPQAAGKGAAAPPAPDGDAFFVSVSRGGQTELHRFDNPREAQGFVEEMLAAGIPQDEVTAFSGRRLALMVSHRPVVKLLGGEKE